MTDSRKGFGPTLLVGVLAAAATSVAAAKPWFQAPVDYKLLPGVREPDRSADMPLALALSLVVLAGWGALLVTRGRARRVVAAIGLLGAIGVVGSVVAAPFTLPDQVRDNLPAGSSDIAVSLTGWYVLAAVGAVISLGVLAVAWMRSPSWPTMSTRYDAPATRTTEPADTDLWKALDAGHDPTDPNHRADPPSP